MLLQMVCIGLIRLISHIALIGRMGLIWLISRIGFACKLTGKAGQAPSLGRVGEGLFFTFS